MDRGKAVEIYKTVRKALGEGTAFEEELSKHLWKEAGEWWLHCNKLDMKIDLDGLSIYTKDRELIAYHSKDLIKLLTDGKQSSIVMN